MNNRKLMKDLRHAWQIRCKYWATCNVEHCEHYNPHHSVSQRCIYKSPVKYCSAIKGFAYDIPYSRGSYAEDDCDPNLAFKAKRDAEKQHDPYKFPGDNNA